uniref:Ubiquitin-like protease family profile domain-containing protein n=1 Tax=Chenopodium quinoa TaxID=63459 RepID=A0A803MRC9_CHEQI
MVIQKECTFLAPVANRVIDYKIINYGDNVKEIRNLDWCGYVLNNLCKEVGSFKKNKHKESRTGISGCVLILQIVYFHHLSSRGQPEPTTLPLIKHWTDEKVRKRIASEAKASFGQGEIQKDVNFADRERRLVSFNLPDGVMIDNEIHEAAHDNLKKRRKRKRTKTKRRRMKIKKKRKKTKRRKRKMREKKKDEKQQEKEAEVSVAVDVDTTNQPIDGDDIDEEPNEDLTNVVRSITKSILKDIVVQEKQPNVTKKATEKTIESDGDKELVAEETIVLKNIHQEIASKININVDCGEKDVEVDFVLKSMRSNKSRMNEMPELYQVVVDYCFSEELVKYEAPLMITRDDTRPLELSLMSQDPSQPTPKTYEKEIPSPSTHTAELNQAWYDWMCLCDAKEKIMTAQLIFVPICLNNHYSLVMVNLLKETIQYLDNRKYDDRHKPFYKILASLVVEEMLNFLKRINHEKANEILDYEFGEVKFKWKSPKYTLDCGVFMMMHMLCFTGDPFGSDLDLENRRKVYRAEICDTLALAEINTKRKSLVEKFSRFRVVRKLEQEKEVKDMIYVSDFLKTRKEVMENMSLKCNQVIDYLAINDDENFPNKVSTNLIIAWSNHLNNNERQKERSENDMVRFFFGLYFMDALTMCLNAHGKKGVTSLQKLWIA